MSAHETYAILGSTGKCGTALIENLLKRPKSRINAYCRNRNKLLRLLPETKGSGRVDIFEGSIQDHELLASCIRDVHAVFLVISTNDNIPNCRMARDTADAVIQVLWGMQDATARGGASTKRMPKIILLSSATIDENLSRNLSRVLHFLLLRSASHVYEDLIEAEALLRAQEDWLTSVFIKPGALSVDVQRGHALSLSDEESPVSYLDLAAAMIEAADEDQGCYDMKNVSVVNTNGKARFPLGTPVCLVIGLLRHYFPFLHPYLPMNMGPHWPL
jgi:putative NADH-flavin reductase